MTWRVVQPIAHIKQPSATSCWAAATAMACGRRSGKHPMVWDVQQTAKNKGIRVLPNGRLPINDFTNVNKLAAALGLTASDRRRRGMPNLRRMKQTLAKGRIALLAQFDDGASLEYHAITLYRMWKDNLGTVFISYVDPSNGRAKNSEWSFFRGTHVKRSFYMLQ